MKICGNKRVSVLFEDEFGKILIENYCLNEIINYIALHSFVDLQFDKENRQVSTRYIIADNMQCNANFNIKMKLTVTTYSSPFKEDYNVTITDTKLSEFHNTITNIAEDYAYELDTDINNIKIILNELEISNLEGE